MDWKRLIFEREAPFYTANLTIWNEAASALNGGRKYIRETLKRHPSETEEEYRARVDNSYNINLIKYATKRFGDYIFSTPPRRQGANPVCVKDFDRKQAHINTVMREIFDYHTIFSLVWVFVDMPRLSMPMIDLASKEKNKIRPYGRAVAPMQVPDWSFGETGDLDWVILEEFVLEKTNPLLEPVEIQRRTLYTRDYWQVFERVLETGIPADPSLDIIAYDPVPNAVGIVPVVPYTTMLPERLVTVPPVEDLLTIHNAVLAGESELLTNILKQTYGQLVLPATATTTVNQIKARLAQRDPNIDFSDPVVNEIIAREVNVVLSRTKAIMETEEERGIARYIQPAGATIDSIVSHNNRLMDLMMRLYGFLVGVNTTQRASAESKAVDHTSLASQLVSIASGLEELETRMWELMNKFDSAISVPQIEYNRDFDIHELNAVITAMVELVNLDCGTEYNRQLKRTAVNILNNLHHIPDEVHETIQKEIEDDSSAKSSIKFEEEAKHSTEASGQRPDRIDAKKPYLDSDGNRMKKTDAL